MSEYDPERCKGTRNTIEEIARWLDNVTYYLDEGDEDYDAQQEELSDQLIAVVEAFEARPEGCLMDRSGDLILSCMQCRFGCDFD